MQSQTPSANIPVTAQSFSQTTTTTSTTYGAGDPNLIKQQQLLQQQQQPLASQPLQAGAARATGDIGGAMPLSGGGTTTYYVRQHVVPVPPAYPSADWMRSRSPYAPPESLWLAAPAAAPAPALAPAYAPLGGGLAAAQQLPLSAAGATFMTGEAPLLMPSGPLAAQQPIPALATASIPLQMPLIPGKRWAVAFDNSDAARAAIMWLASVLDVQRRDEVQFIHIMERRNDVGGMPLLSDSDSTRMQNRLREIQGAVDAECSMLKRFAPNTLFHAPIIVKPAQTASHKKAMFDTMQEYKGKFDCMVLGTRRLTTGMQRMMKGSVSRTMLKDPFVPLVLVRADSLFIKRVRDENRYPLAANAPFYGTGAGAGGAALPGQQQQFAQQPLAGQPQFAQQPLLAGQQQPFIAGQQQPMLAGQQQPWIAGQQQPFIAGQQQPFIAGQQQPQTLAAPAALSPNELAPQLGAFKVSDRTTTTTTTTTVVPATNLAQGAPLGGAAGGVGAGGAGIGAQAGPIGAGAAAGPGGAGIGAQAGPVGAGAGAGPGGAGIGANVGPLAAGAAAGPGGAALGAGNLNNNIGPIVLGAGTGNLTTYGGAQYPFLPPLSHTWLILLDGSDESRRAVQFVLTLVRNIDTLYFVNAIGGRSQIQRPDIVDMNYPMTSAGVTYSNDSDRILHKNKLVLANAMSELQTGYANRPSPRVLSHVYYANTINGAIENAIADTRADTVVLGSSGLGQKRGLGSVTSWVVANAHTNVIVVPPSNLDHKAMRHMHVNDKPYQKEKKTHRVFGRDRDVDFFSS